jgi:hypothetical protein
LQYQRTDGKERRPEGGKVNMTPASDETKKKKRKKLKNELLTRAETRTTPGPDVGISWTVFIVITSFRLTLKSKLNERTLHQADGGMHGAGLMLVVRF